MSFISSSSSSSSFFLFDITTLYFLQNFFSSLNVIWTFPLSLTLRQLVQFSQLTHRLVTFPPISKMREWRQCSYWPVQSCTVLSIRDLNQKSSVGFLSLQIQSGHLLLKILFLSFSNSFYVITIQKRTNGLMADDFFHK